jgi:GTP-binding protein HflX
VAVTHIHIHMHAHDTRLDGGRAVVAARATDQRPDTAEIEGLAESAGYEIVAALTQRRREDAGTWLGRGTAEAVADRAAETDADAVILDGDLSPGQHASLVDLLPAGIDLVDRYRLVLDIFASGATDRRAALQIESATLRYRLPRLRQVTEESLLNEATEKGSPVIDAERRIDAIEAKLDDIAERARKRRAERREAGFGLVAIAGYTNAGKSTLLHRLAEDLAVEDRGPDHPDLDATAPVEDRLFVTLETVTRRGTVGGRDVLYTDTVGLVDALPHDLVESFSATLTEVAAADVALLVVDATDPPERLREKVRVSLAALDDPRGELVAVLNKIDASDAAGVAERRAALADLVPDVVAVSALEGRGIDRLRERIGAALPTDQATFRLPNDEDAQAFLAWAHDHGAVVTRYESDTVRVDFRAPPGIVERARARAPEP